MYFIIKKGTKYRHHVDSCFPQNNSTKTIFHHFPFPCSFDRHQAETNQEVGNKWHENMGQIHDEEKRKHFLISAVHPVSYIS